MTQNNKTYLILITVALTAASCVLLLLCGGGAAMWLIGPEMLSPAAETANQRPPDAAGAAFEPPAAETNPAEPPVTEGEAETEAETAVEPEVEAPAESPPGEIVEIEAGNMFEEAAPISPGRYGGHISAEEEDWYKFEVPGGGIIEVSFTAGGDVPETQSVTLYDPERESIRHDVHVKPGRVADLAWITNASQSGFYYIRVGHGKDGTLTTNGTGSYTVELTMQNQDDAALGSDAGDEFPQAVAIQAGQPITGQLGGADRNDWYKLEVPGGHILDLTFTPGADVAETQSIFAFDADYGEPIWEEQHVFPSVNHAGRWIVGAEMGGTYFFQITYGHRKNGTGSYTFEVTVQPQNDANGGGDAGGEPVKGLDIQPGQPLSGEVGNFDEFDCYKFAPATGQTVSFTPGEETNGMGIQVFDADLEQIWRERSVGPTVNKTHQLAEVEGGTYYLCVGNVGQYTVEVRP